MEDIKTKLKSRKLWVALAAAVLPLIAQYLGGEIALLDALPWVISTITLVALVVLCVVHACRRSKALTPSRAAAQARQDRRRAREATEANLERIAGALESDNAEELLAAEANRAREERTR